MWGPLLQFFGVAVVVMVSDLHRAGPHPIGIFLVVGSAAVCALQIYQRKRAAK